MEIAAKEACTTESDTEISFLRRMDDPPVNEEASEADWTWWRENEKRTGLKNLSAVFHHRS